MRLGRDELLDLSRSSGLEWLETDGLGGCASATVLLSPARRYHGLLVSPRPGTTRRHVWLSRFEETLVAGGQEMPLSIARYRGVWSPHGHQALESFELAPWPRWTWLWGRVRIVREVLMVREEPRVFVRWRVDGAGEPVALRLKPLLAFREADALTFENGALDRRVDAIDGGIACQPYAGLPRIAIALDGEARFHADPVWYRGLEYALDLARGYDGHEDQFSPGWFDARLQDGQALVVEATLARPSADPSASIAREESRRAGRSRRAAAHGSPVRSALEVGSEAFLYRAADGRRGVIAGWPWFGEWGRDTYLSLPGLLAPCGRNAELGEALAGALEFLQDGLLPNTFGTSRADSGYDSVDASLWFARAVRLHELSGAPASDVARRFLPALLEIAERYQRGTALGVRADEDGLLLAGAPELNATWMDARIDSVPVTPRDGYAVEMQALWYFLLAYVEHLLRAAGRDLEASAFGARRQRAGSAFLRRFWLEDEERLADVARADGVDRALRPNQVIAAALEWSPLSRAQRGLVAKSAREVLLVPRGLRTLDPRHPEYRGSFTGGPHERDRAYHQGTVWPWLLGFFVEAWLRGVGEGAEDRAWLRSLLDGFEPHLAEAGCLHVSEVFDGDPPHAPGGCSAQAWSEAEILRAYALLEDAPR